MPRLISSVRSPREPGSKTVDGLEVRELTATGSTYDEAKQSLYAQLPGEGWILLGIMTIED